MGDSAIVGSGLVNRTAKFFNNKSFSDLEFQVKDTSGNTTFYAHKLILIMASEVFERQLKKSGLTEKITIQDFTPRTVHLTLQYLYTDELDLTSVKEAMDVYRLASKFGVKELVERCKDYIGLDRITEDKVFLLYDIALKDGNMRELLYKCQDLIRRKTTELLDSMQFCNASVEVLKDILNQKALAVDNEITIINAVLRWCKRDCARRGRPTESLCIRDSINPFLPYLRFLTLSPDEFLNFLEEYSIFTSPESAKLTRKLLAPQSDCEVPPGFCPNFNPREKINTNDFKPDPIRSAPPRVTGNAVERRLNLKDTPRSGINNEINTNGFKFDPTKMSTPPRITGNAVEQKLSTPRSEANNEPLWTIKQPQQDFSISPEPDMQPASPIFTFPPKGNWNDNASSRRPVPLERPAELPRKPPMLKIVPNTNAAAKKHFEFPLQEVPKGMSSVSLRDVKCSAEIQVSKGKIVIYGVELKVLSLPHLPDETLRVGLSISGNNCPETDTNSSIKLRNNVIPVMFMEPISLSYNNSAKIEVTIEDLKLNRCSVCRRVTYELNMGLNLAAVINLRSNQSNEADGFLFLISRIIYS